MDQDPGTHPSYAMTEPQLVAVLTRQQHQYNDHFRAVTSRELARRGTDLETLLNSVAVRFQDKEPQAATIDQALAKLDEETPLWPLWTFTNFFEEALVVQKDSRTWVVHHYANDEYTHSSFVANRARLQELLSRFLRLQSWDDLVETTHQLDSWKALIDSKSTKYLAKVAAELDKAQIPYTVKSPLISGAQEKWLSVIVPEEEMAAANTILDDIEKQLLDLYHRATELADTTNRIEEVRIYDLLVDIVPHNPAVFYNRGSALLEMDHYQDAADSFIEAVSIIVDQESKEVRFDGRPRGRMGGTFGMAMTLFDSLARAREKTPTATPPDYPELIDDAELFLLQLTELLPNYTRILHCLANISRLKQDLPRVESLYEDILAIDPKDQLAHTNLNYLKSANTAEPTNT